MGKPREHTHASLVASLQVNLRSDVPRECYLSEFEIEGEISCYAGVTYEQKFNLAREINVYGEVGLAFSYNDKWCALVGKTYQSCDSALIFKTRE